MVKAEPTNPDPTHVTIYEWNEAPDWVRAAFKSHTETTKNVSSMVAVHPLGNKFSPSTAYLKVLGAISHSFPCRLTTMATFHDNNVYGVALFEFK